MSEQITKEMVKQLYIKYDNPKDHPDGGRDSWDVAADIINELEPRSRHETDAGYYYHIHVVWTWVEEYLLNSGDEE